jgi:hypothetical protein
VGGGSIEPKASHDAEKGAVMTKLIALLAVGVTAFASAVFFWQKSHRKPSRWTAAKESASAWGKAAAQAPGKAAERVVR